MKRVLFDHNVPGPLERFLQAHHVRLADEMEWARLRNGHLLAAAENADFDVLLSGDKTIRYEQDMAGRKIALIYMSANHWPIVQNHIPAILDTIEQVRPGEIKPVDCGTFVPRKFQKPGGPSF